MNKIIAVIAVFVFALTTSSAQNAKPAPKDIPTLYAKAIDDKNLKAFGALFNEDAVFDDLGTVSKGREEIVAFGQKIIDFQGQYVTREIKVSGEKITWLFDFTGGGGSYKLRGQGDFVIKNGLIQRLKIAAQR
jgi:hypothetical protein